MTEMDESSVGSGHPSKLPLKEWRLASVEDLDIELCDICRKINWHAVLLDCCPDSAQNDWPYRWADIPTFRQMEIRQLHCSFCRLCIAGRDSRPPLQEQSLADMPLQIVWYARNLRYGRPRQNSAKDVRRKAKIKLADSMGFRLFVQRRSIDSQTLHLNMEYVPSPIFQLIPAADEVPSHRKKLCGRAIPITGADPTLLKHWVDNCKMKHGTTCDIAYSGFRKKEWAQLAEHLGLEFRFRVIDVEQSRIVEAPRNCSYVALSYVWGKLSGIHRARKCDLKPSPENPDIKYLDIPEEGIPRTVRDAMGVTATLGQRYLWVDALCIIQDDIEELSATLEAMDMVYAAADVVIIAASGTNANYGLPGALPGSRRTYQPSERICGITMFQEAQPLSEALATSCWRTRAWTYQEEYFSTRLLIFSDTNVYFKCRNAETCEDIAIDDGNTQSYFLNSSSGSSCAVWLRVQDHSSAEEVCYRNTRSLDNSLGSRPSEEHMESSNAGIVEMELDRKFPSTQDPRARDDSSRPNYDNTILTDWRFKIRLWLDKQQYALCKEWPASPQKSPNTAADEALKSSRLEGIITRRQSTTSFTVRTDDMRSLVSPTHLAGQAVTTRPPERTPIHIFSFNIPTSIDLNQLSPQSRSLARFRWMTPKALSKNYYERNTVSFYSRTRKKVIDVIRSEHPRKKLKLDNCHVDIKLCQEYATAVRDFTPRSLTQQSDILNAFKGITNHFERLMGIGFAYGLPLTVFDYSLLWRDASFWESAFGDWASPCAKSERWDAARGRCNIYTHQLEDLKMHREFLKDQEGKGCVRAFQNREDCDQFPTWSWCGWKGPVRYDDKQYDVLELNSEIIWPWKPEYAKPSTSAIQSKSFLQVHVHVAFIDLSVLRSLKSPDIFWGWLVENGQRIREGVVECILLSTGKGSYLKERSIDPVPELFHNIMIIGRDKSGGAVYRRGIAQLYPEDWEMFKPKKEWICLR